MNDKFEKILQEKNIFDSYFLKFIVLFIFTFISVYYLPNIINKIYFIILFILFATSKDKYYYWLSFIFLLHFNPASFFSEGSGEIIHRLPLYTLMPGVSLSAPDILTIIALIKSINIILVKKRKIVFSYKLKNILILILIHSILLLIISIIVYKTQIKDVVWMIRNFFRITYLFSLPVLLQKKEDFINFFLLSMPFTILNFVSGLYFMITGGNYLYGLVSDINNIQLWNLSFIDIDYGRFLLHGDGIHILFFSIINSMIFSFYNKKYKIYFYNIIILCYITVIITSTRAWIVIYSIILLYYMFLQSASKMIITTLILMFIITIFIQQYIAFALVFERISTLTDFAVISMDLSNRTAVRAIPAISGIMENPILGWGFTTHPGGSEDSGNFALIFEVGILGFIYFIILWKRILNLLNKSIERLDSIEKINTLKILKISFIGLLISHFTTTQIFSIEEGVFLPVLFIFMVEYYVYNFNLNVK